MQFVLVPGAGGAVPIDVQRRVARERLGRDIEVVPGGHLTALSRPRELGEHLLGLVAQLG